MDRQSHRGRRVGTKRRLVALALLVTCALAAGALCAPAASALQQYDYHSQFGVPVPAPTATPAPGQFAFPQYAALDASGNIYVADTHNLRIQVFDPTGVFQRFIIDPTYGAFAGNHFDQPTGVAVGASTVYVTDYTYGCVDPFTLSGTFLPPFWGLHDANGDPTDGSGNGEMYWPNGLAVDAADNVYVADTNNQRVVKFASTGAFVCNIGVGGTHALQGPLDVAVDPAGNVYVADFLRMAVMLFKPVTGGTTATSYAYAATWGGLGSPPGDIGEPRGIAIDAHNNIYVTDDVDGQIVKLSPAGDLLARWGDAGTGNGQFQVIVDVAVASDDQALEPDGTVYATDRDNSRVQLFTPVDNGAVTFAYRNLVVRHGRATTFKFKGYDDFSPTLTFTIKIKKGSVVKKTIAAGVKKSAAWATKRWTVTLPAGKYKWYVYARDLAGHMQTTPIGVKALTIR